MIWGNYDDECPDCGRDAVRCHCWKKEEAGDEAGTAGRLRSHHQRALPFVPGFPWFDHCRRCGDQTFIDDQRPVGMCPRCVQELGARRGEPERRHMAAFSQAGCPGWGP